MLTRHILRAVVHAALALAVSATSAMGASGFEQESPRTEVRRTPDTHCHDLGPMALTCFPTEAERDAALGAFAGDDIVLASSSGYVVAYSSPSFGGSSVVLSQDYGHLGHIGWDDRISSYKAYTPLTGYFFEHTWYGGRAQAYCCNAQVTYVGDALNNRFSSFDLP
jgi:hypothetical protein